MSRVGIRSSALETVVFRAGALPFAFMTTVITSRLLHPEGQGAYILGILIATMAATLLSVSVSTTHAVGRGEPPGAVLKRGIQLSALTGTATGAVMFVPLAFVGAHLGRPVWIAALAVPAIVVTQAIGGVLVVERRVREWNVCQLLVQMLPCLLTAGLVWWGGYGVGGALVAWVLGQWGVAGVALAFGIRRTTTGIAQGRPTPLLPLALRSGAVNLLSQLNYRVDLLLLGVIAGAGAVGVYSLAVQLAELLWLLSGALATAVVATVVRGDERRAVELVCQACRQAVILTAVAAAAVVAVATVAIPPVFGEAYAGARLPLVVLAVGAVVYSPGSVLAVYFSMRQGRMRVAVVAVALSAAVTAALCWPLISSGGATGAAIASDAGYAVGIGVAVLWFVRAAPVRLYSLIPRGSDLAAYPALLRRLSGREAAPATSVSESPRP